MTRPPFAAVEHSLGGRLTLGPLCEADASSIAAMLAAQEPWRSLGYREGGLARYLLRDDPGLHRFAVHTGEPPARQTPAGVVCIRHPWLRGPYIELIGFAPGARGQGAGGAILAWIEAQTPDAANLWAFVSEGNAAARRFYAATGFAEVAPVADLVAPGRCEILLRKRLAGTPDHAGGGVR